VVGPSTRIRKSAPGVSTYTIADVPWSVTSEIASGKISATARRPDFAVRFAERADVARWAIGVAVFFVVE
jgi:hypothetical protein